MIFYKIDSHKCFHDFKSCFVMIYNGFIKGIDIWDKVWSAQYSPKGIKNVYLYYCFATISSTSSRVVKPLSETSNADVNISQVSDTIISVS